MSAKNDYRNRRTGKRALTRCEMLRLMGIAIGLAIGVAIAIAMGRERKKS
jgi:hypothetical protein